MKLFQVIIRGRNNTDFLIRIENEYYFKKAGYDISKIYKDDDVFYINIEGCDCGFRFECKRDEIIDYYVIYSEDDPCERDIDDVFDLLMLDWIGLEK